VPSANKGFVLDIWDFGRLLRRRWRIAVPILLVALVMTALVFTQVKPDYVATAYVQLVPPVPTDTTPGNNQTPDLRNPWLGQDLRTLGNAALVSVQDLGYVQSLKDKGYSDSFTAIMGDSTPLVTFEVTGKSAAQVEGTATQLVSRYSGSVASLQTSYGATLADEITARRLDAGTNITVSSSNKKRAVVAVLAAGILLSVAITVSADAWLRRREQLAAQRASEAEPTPELPEPDVRGDAKPTADHRPEPLETSPLTMQRIFTSGGTNGSGPLRHPNDRRLVDDDRSSDATIAIRTGFAGHDLPADATVILPKAMPANEN
jgi:hypothetical protein